jgi:anti-sigma regulatory factor (Ser/Thr protein kinase)
LLSARESTAISHGDHVVQFYERDADLVASVGDYLVEAALERAVSVVIATEGHRKAFAEHLKAHGVDADAAQRQGSLLLFDAAATLDRFMRDGRIVRNAFFEVIGGVIRDAVGKGRPVRAYGEMVALLWDAGDVLAAIELETLWNELAGELPFALYCAYHSESVAVHEHADALHDVCRLHSAVVPAPGEVLDVSADFPAQASAAADARRLVADTVRRWGHEHPLVADAELVATELAANAIIHARMPFRVSVHRFGPVVRIAVHDCATALPAVLEPDPARLTGRGMSLIGAISRRWGVEVTPDGKTVWTELGRSDAE